MSSKLKYFKKLGLPPTASQAEIKRAYRKKAMRFHPDKNDSADAQLEFIAVTEAYEALTNVKKTVIQPTTVKSPEEVRAEKIRKAQERYQRMQKNEKEKDIAYFTKITTGLNWRLFKGLAIHSFCLMILLSIDYFATWKSETTADQTAYSHITSALSLENQIFIIDDNYWQGEFPPIQKNYSFFFKDLKSINVMDTTLNLNQKTVPSDQNKRFDLFDRYPSTTFYAHASTYKLFPYFHIFLIIPFLLVLFKRPNFNFALWRLVCIWVIFPVSIYLTFSDGRIFYLFVWW